MICAPFRPMLVAVLGLAFLAGFTPQCAAQAPLEPEVADFIDEMVGKHQFRRAELARLFAKVQPRPSIIRAMTAPATAKPWHEFR